MKFWHDNEYFHENPQEFFKSKKLRDTLLFAAFIVVAIIASALIEFDLPLIFQRFPNAMKRFMELYFPISFKDSEDLIEAIWLTIILAISSGTIGTILAYLAALGMSKRTGKNPVIKFILRGLATFIRNVPASIWAIMLLMAFWFGEFLAMFVMILGTFGFNARLFSDMIDETNHHSIEALEATGATYWQIILQAVFPETLPVAISWALYAVETNIRSATIIGMLAGGGIGHLIGIFKHFRRFDQLTGAVVVIVMTILMVDQVSIQIRKRIL